MTPPKQPRAGTQDRDAFVPKHANQSQAAEPTPLERGAVEAEWIDEKTSPTATPLEAIEHRQRRSMRQTMEARGDVRELRAEVKADMITLGARVDVMGEHLGDVRAELGELGGAVRTLIPLVQQQAAANIHHQTIKMTATVDVDKAIAMEPLEVRRFWRDLSMKFVVGAVIPIVATLATLITLLAKKC